MFKVLCYVRDDDYRHVFEIKIGMEESVATLKEAIKEETSKTFRDVDAKSLVLWKASVLFDRNLKEIVEALNPVDDDALQPLEILL
jgi:Crinkler effector protein N-terminal domain